MLGIHISLLTLISGTNELCSPIQPLNNIKAASTSTRNQCFIASTPADVFSSTSVHPNPKHQTQDSSKWRVLWYIYWRFRLTIVSILDVTDSFDDDEPANASTIVPQFNVLQRHNVTVPAISRGSKDFLYRCILYLLELVTVLRYYLLQMFPVRYQI